MYKAILFDLDNTLLNYDTSEHEAMRQTIDVHRLAELEGFEWETFRTVFAPINWNYWINRVEHRLHISQVLDYSFRDTLLQMGHDSTLSRSLASTYWKIFSATCHFMDGTEELLARLHGRYRVGIVSNGIGEAQRKRLAAGGVSHYFQHLFISDEIGVSKPDKLIFDRAVEALGVDRSEILFVGDSLTDDYEGARMSRIDFCHYNPNRKPVREEISPAHTIHALSELVDIITREEGHR
ncbi:YjjG family noncanonical pyrimidine nucleotidase [Paenibacillus sp. R14(2021)]|uniref:YjjG family noncanonical pyrimidine nucleotidase n=1 Tax=Paenibacillus sp. R14(2021) TaxID=2859228 RepID=UPI001C613A58|nr:YjjG family noncanonical pyrimidine nucleotidase [Paenibacillus sp. R14(2021)]